MRTSSITRAEFLHLALAGLAATTAVACGGDDDPAATDAAATADAAAADAAATDASGALDAAGGDGGDPTDGGGGDAAASCLQDGTVVTIGTNHGHALTVPAAHVQAGAERTYDIQGASAHAHAVTLTASHFALLAQGQSVQVTSTSAGHTHVVIVACA